MCGGVRKSPVAGKGRGAVSAGEGEGRFSVPSCGWNESPLCSPSHSCSVWGESLAWGTCSDMGASDWFAANSGRGQVALCFFVVFSVTVGFSASANPCFIIAVRCAVSCT